MSYQIPTSFVKQYSANVQLLSQQKGSRLRRGVRVETVVGEQAYFDQIGKTAAVKRVTRHSDTPLVDTPHSRRRVTMVDYDLADLVDNLDKVKTLNDPTNQYAMNMGNAMGRAMDDALIAAFSATALTGVEGGTSTVFAAANQIADGNTGMSIAKILEAKELLDKADVDPEMPRFIALSPKQISDLLVDAKVGSSDYNTVKALAQGEMNTFCGFEFIMSNRLTVASDIRTCLAWAQQGMLLAVGREPRAEIEQRPDKNYATQVYFGMTIGSTRMDEEMCVEIGCDETPD